MFLRSIELYEVHSTCAYNECMFYAPVLLKITAEAIKQQVGANFLLQVWRKGGKCLFELPL